VPRDSTPEKIGQRSGEVVPCLGAERLAGPEPEEGLAARHETVSKRHASAVQGMPRAERVAAERLVSDEH
jgi:hypothetical protein